MTSVHCDGCHVTASIRTGPLRVYLRELRRFRDRHHRCAGPIVQKLASGIEGEDVGLRGSHRWHKDGAHAERSRRKASLSPRRKRKGGV